MELNILTPAQEECLLDILTDPRCGETYMLPEYSCREEAVPLARRLMALSEDPNRFVRGIYRDGALVGFLNDVEIREDTLELGYVVHPDFWGRGCATKGLKLAIGELFALGFREVLAGAFQENAASLRVMEKAGMVPLSRKDTVEYRGVLRNCLYRHICKE